MTSVTDDTSGVLYNISRACTIYCEGPVLETIQLAEIYNDSKTFVDMPMIYEPEQVMNNFNAIPDKTNVTQLKQFLSANFFEAGSDLVDWTPTDYQEYPSLYYEIPDSYPYKNWFKDLNSLWLILGRNISDSVVQHPEKHSYLPRPFPMIVPGGRFRESYYWDSYWIVRGLLICSMNQSSYNIIQNLLTDVSNFGFVPNGGRIYYLDRSQPPLLSEMVLTYFDHMLKQGHSRSNQFLGNFVVSAYEKLMMEYNFWMNATNGHLISLVNPRNSSETLYLNRYYSNYTTPRPESYTEDYYNSEQSIRSVEGVNFFYRSTRAGAETGWDFSSRWILGGYNISYIDTINIIPVELNTFMYKFELNLAKLSLVVNSITGQNNDVAAKRYLRAAIRRYEAIQTFLWDNSSFHWRDFNISSKSFVTPIRQNYSAIAYWLPLWAGIYPNQPQYSRMIQNEVYESPFVASIDRLTADNLVKSLLASDLIQVGGILTTSINTGQQWDAPNAWPPLVALTIEGLRRMETPLSLSLATNLTFLWLNTCYLAYNHTGYMYEKYDAFVVGKGGGGGEYTPQKGFGWSNGVALILINDTYRAYLSDSSSDSSNEDSTSTIIAVVLSVVLVTLLSAMAFFYFYPKYFRALCGTMLGRRYDEPPATATVSLTVPLAKAEIVNNPMV